MLTVFGSINLDVSVRSASLPRPGETVLGSHALLSPGGKGANQAHAAQRVGMPTRLFGKVGRDAFAPAALRLLHESGVDLTGVTVSSGESTGLALVTVGESGENTIVVAPGANAAARAADVPDSVLRHSEVLLMQLEVPLREVAILATRARRLGCKVVLNASPLPPRGTLMPLHAIDLLIVNRIELDQLGAEHDVNGDGSLERAHRLAARLRVDVLVTLGMDGSLLARADGTHERADAVPANVVDTTGAGDTYAGVLCAALASGEASAHAMALASAAAALACQGPGAQAPQPSRTAIETLMEISTARRDPPRP